MGIAVGDAVGINDGIAVVGTNVGDPGNGVGSADGAAEGFAEGLTVGDAVGIADGTAFAGCSFTEEISSSATSIKSWIEIPRRFGTPTLCDW